jgi:excisionase family DNA binding protein
MSYTLEEVAERTGKSQDTLRKAIQRGRLRSDKDEVSGRNMVTEEALEDYVGSELMEDAADEVRLGNHEAAGVLLAQLPTRIKQAISNTAVKPAKAAFDPKTTPPGDFSKHVTFPPGTKITGKPGIPYPAPEFRPVPKPGKKK